MSLLLTRFQVNTRTHNQSQWNNEIMTLIALIQNAHYENIQMSLIQESLHQFLGHLQTHPATAGLLVSSSHSGIAMQVRVSTYYVATSVLSTGSKRGGGDREQQRKGTPKRERAHSLQPQLTKTSPPKCTAGEWTLIETLLILNDEL